MSKGIAIQTILLLLVGIIVVGIVVYLVYSTTTSSSLDKNQCMTLVMNLCTNCMNSGWDSSIAITDPKYFDCDRITYGTDQAWWNDNTDCDDMKADCPNIFKGMFI